MVDFSAMALRKTLSASSRMSSGRSDSTSEISLTIVIPYNILNVFQGRVRLILCADVILTLELSIDSGIGCILFRWECVKSLYSAGARVYILSVVVKYIIREQPQRHDCCRLPWWLSKSRAFSNLDPRSATKYNATDSFTLETNCTCRLFLMIPSLLSAPKVNVTSQYISGNPSLTLVQSPDLLFIELWGEI